MAYFYWHPTDYFIKVFQTSLHCFSILKAKTSQLLVLFCSVSGDFSAFWVSLTMCLKCCLFNARKIWLRTTLRDRTVNAELPLNVGLQRAGATNQVSGIHSISVLLQLWWGRSTWKTGQYYTMTADVSNWGINKTRLFLVCHRLFQRKQSQENSWGSERNQTHLTKSVYLMS